jgi:hypothetical protein
MFNHPSQSRIEKEAPALKVSVMRGALSSIYDALRTLNNLLHLIAKQGFLLNQTRGEFIKLRSVINDKLLCLSVSSLFRSY